MTSNHINPDAREIAVLVYGTRMPARIYLWEQSPENTEEVKLRLEFDGKAIEARSERGYFRALCDLRVQLEAHGVLVECYGASRNIHPSPMIESMGSGEKAYRLTLGRPATRADLVNIFDSGPDANIVTVRQQEDHYKHWLESLR